MPYLMLAAYPSVGFSTIRRPAKKKMLKMMQQLVMEMEKLKYVLAWREPLMPWRMSWKWRTVKSTEPREFACRMGCMVQALVNIQILEKEITCLEQWSSPSSTRRHGAYN